MSNQEPKELNIDSAGLNPVVVGQTMWHQLVETFLDVANANGFSTYEARTQFWGGFIGCASGAMAADIGKESAVLMLESFVRIVSKLGDEDRKNNLPN
ncbi:MAG: hypothetical protein V4501_08260 [Pseudomonadota bacterium]